MPHHIDLLTVEGAVSDIETLEIDVIGWKKPIHIEYRYVDTGVTQLYWRVKGTTHTFTIPVSNLNQMSSGDYVNHFQQTLTVFRDDIINWAANGLTEKWMREYIYMFKNYIIF